ncbi:MAG: ABC transporter permease [Ruminiclostridium sp.]
MKRISYEYVILFVQMTMIGFFLIILSNYYIVSQNKDFLGNDTFSNHVLGVSISYAEPEHDKTDYQLPYNAFEGSYMIYKHISADNHIKRGIYGTNDVFEFSNYIEEGRFFSEQDFQNDKPITVIGTDILSETIMKEGIRYYGVNDSLYEVIGVFRETREDLDNTVFLNLNYLLKHENVTGLYYIDAKETNTAKKIITEIENSIPKELSTMEIKHEKIKEALLPSYKIIYCLVIITAFCNLIITSYFFVIRQKYKTAVKKLCGLTNQRMAFEYGRLIGILTLGAFALTVVAISLFHNNTLLKMNQLSLINYVLVLFLLILVGVVITYQVVWNSMKVDISSTLKG